MAKILLGIATVTPDQRFLESLPLFYAEASKKHEIDIKWIWHKPLVEAQNEMAECLMKGDYEYLLTIEDDHHGFTADMLEACLSHDSQVCGISYRSRHFPFEKIPMRESYTPNGKEPRYGMTSHFTSGYHEVQLMSFGFSLFKKEIFNLLDKPYFQLNRIFNTKGPRATDIDLSIRLREKGVKLYGCFDYILPHRDITEEGIKDFIVHGIIAKHSLYSNFQNMLENDRRRTIKENEHGLQHSTR